MIQKCLVVLAVVAQISAFRPHENQNSAFGKPNFSSDNNRFEFSYPPRKDYERGQMQPQQQQQTQSNSMSQFQSSMYKTPSFNTAPITKNIVAKGKYPVALQNCGPVLDKKIPVYTSHVRVPVQEKPTVRLPTKIPAPKTIAHSCTCYKTILKPRVHQTLITVPSIQRYIETTHKPVIENIHYEACPIKCPEILTESQPSEQSSTVQNFEIPSQVSVSSMPQFISLNSVSSNNQQQATDNQMPQYSSSETSQSSSSRNQQSSGNQMMQYSVAEPSQTSSNKILQFPTMESSQSSGTQLFQFSALENSQTPSTQVLQFPGMNVQSFEPQRPQTFDISKLLKENEAKTRQQPETPKIQYLDPKKPHIIELPRIQFVETKPIEEVPKFGEEKKPQSVQYLEAPKAQAIEIPCIQFVEAQKPQSSQVEMPFSQFVGSQKSQDIELPRIQFVESQKPQTIEIPRVQFVEAEKFQTVEIPRVQEEPVKAEPTQQCGTFSFGSRSNPSEQLFLSQLF